jgi:hypothetical protein
LLSIVGSSFSNSASLFETTFFGAPGRYEDCQGYIGGGAMFVRMFQTFIDSSSFIGNSASTRPFQINNASLLNPAFANGGAILLRGSASAAIEGRDSVSAVASNCNFTRNAASGGGAAVFIESGSTLTLSQSVVANNFGFIAAVLCQGMASIASTLFVNNSAAVVASDFFLSCVSAACEAVVSDSTFISLEYSENEEQVLQNEKILGSFQLAKICFINSFVSQGNLFAPKISVTPSSRFIDLRNARGGCKSLTLSIANVDLDLVSKGFNPDFSCGAGSVPTCTGGTSAVFPISALSSLTTILYEFPSFKSQTVLVPVLKRQCTCQPCPTNTFQGIELLPYQGFPNVPFAEASNFFCKPCPFGAICTDSSIMKAIPGFFLWQTNNASNFNVAKTAEKLPPGYGFELESG